MTNKKLLNLKIIGPGIVLAAAGVGAGDIISSGVSGASYGVALLWALLLGALFKYFLNEGMARYQLATGKTFMQGYTDRWSGFNYYFLLYLIIWSFIVGGALLSGIGLVVNAMIPILSIKLGGVLSAILVLIIVLSGKYKHFENIMKALALIMFVTFVISAIMVAPSFIDILKGLLIPTIPVNNGNLFESLFKILALMGGVGGTVTIMAYSYWIREKNIISTKELVSVKIDLLIGYFITFIFGACVIIVAASLIHPTGANLEGKQGIIKLAKSLSQTLGPFGFWAFIIGFWAAIFSSLMSFYQAIPYLFADAVRLLKKEDGVNQIKIDITNKHYKAYVFYCFLPPMILLLFDKPVFLILCYSVLGAFFMPFLSLMLLIIGNEKKLGKFRNTIFFNFVMLLIFAVMSVISFWPFIQKYLLS